MEEEYYESLINDLYTVANMIIDINVHGKEPTKEDTDYMGEVIGEAISVIKNKTKANEI